MKKTYNFKIIINWMKDPKNYIFLIVMIIGFAMAISKYDLINLLVGCLFSLALGFAIRFIFFK
jgi:hypothetical protein